MAPAERTQDHPLVTVIVPCRNEARFIGPMIESLLASTYPRDRLEILFVDGMSVDGTRQSIERAASGHPFIRMLDNRRLVTPAALNLGVKTARGELIVRMDAHAEYPTDYVERCVRLLLSDSNIGSAGGRIINVPGGRNGWAQAVAYVRANPLGVGRVAYITGLRPGYVDTVAFGAFRRQVLLEQGLFDERLTRNQDSEFHARLRRAGLLIAFDPDIMALYRNRATLRSFVRRTVKTSEWYLYTLFLHPYMWSPRRLIPIAFVFYVALLPSVAAFRPGWLRLAAVPLGLYAVLIAACSLRGGRDAAGRLRVAATFACHHFAYGAGAFVGLFNIATGRWRALLGRPI